jgi:large subunit ribosomal protein L4
MAKLDVRGKDGKKVGEIELPAAFAGAKIEPATLHRAVVAEEANARQGTSKTKGRSEVRGGGRKPYRQKKTGRARQGSIRAPHYTHGGTAHEITPRSFEKKLNRKERRAAILGALAAKISEGAVVVADKIAFTEPRTKSAKELLAALEVGDAKRLLVVLPEIDEPTRKSFRNLPNVTVRTAPASKDAGEVKTAAFSARDVLVAHKIVIAKDALSRIQEVWSQ